MNNQQILIRTLANQYLRDNPERFNEYEKIKFLNDLKNFLEATTPEIDDDVYDFLVANRLIKNQNRFIQFARYVNSKYSSSTHPNILDVGAGRMCHLSGRLSRSGFITAIDPNIRITEDEAQNRRISKIIKDNFYCDEFSPNTQGFDVEPYDLLIGLEPCDATEHIIRQGLTYDKPFEVLLCYTAHKALSNKKIKTREDWYNYLESISQEVKINKIDDNYIATNN